MTVDDAAKTLCPFSLSRDAARFCQGPQCHLWKWSAAERERALDAAFTDAIEQMGVKVNDAKSKPTPAQVNEAKVAARHAMKDFTPTQGACALRGEK